MPEISLKFKPEIEKLFPQKMITTRTEKKGDPGDFFFVDGDKYFLIAVFPIQLFKVAHNFDYAEGFTSSQEFIDAWNSCYPEQNYTVQQLDPVWVHVFLPDHLYYQLPEQEGC